LDLVSTSAKPNVALDENFFQDLLAAAYVVQQHNDALRGSSAPATRLSDSSRLSPGQTEFSANPEALPSTCRVCGRPFGSDEVFCGKCSMPRLAAGSSENLQSKWASLWYMQQAQDTAEAAPSQALGQNSLQPASDSRSRGIYIENTPPSSGAAPATEPPTLRRAETSSPGRDSGLAQNAALNMNEQVTPDDEIFQPATPRAIIRNPPAPAEPTNEAVPQADLAQPSRHPLRLRPRGRYLAWVGLLALFVVLAVWPSPKNPQLTLFQSVLVKLGLADVPARPALVKSNPDAKVWVDVHTGLYYCEGSDSYGTTSDGHFATQREAQQDAFEPAERTPCP
jgi:hypothetical protein